MKIVSTVPIRSILELGQRSLRLPRNWPRNWLGQRLVVAALPLVFATGCTTPDITPPVSTIAVPLEWVETEVAPISTDLTEYWRLLDDPLLTELVEQAVVENRDLAVSIARLDQARSTLRIAQAGFLPNVSASGSAARDVGDFSRNGIPFAIGADASWELDLFGQISSNVAASQADLAAQGFALADLQRLIVGQVATSTINARAIATQLDIARDTLAFQNENLQIARWRNQAGLVSSLDVEQARTQRAQTAATIPSLEASLASTANALSTLVGETPGRVLAQFQADTESSARAPVPRPPVMAGFETPAEVLRRRPDVRSAEASLYASSARIGIAQAQLLPLVRLTGNIGTGPVTAGNLFDVITGGLIASVGQLIFDGGSTRAQVDNAQAAARGSLAQWEQTILGALEEVESAAVSRSTAIQRVTINEEAVDAASNSALLARSQYEAGLADFQVLLTAENQLLSARNQLVAAQADRATAFVSLTQALGGGWSAADFDFPLAARGQTNAAGSDRTE